MSVFYDYLLKKLRTQDETTPGGGGTANFKNAKGVFKERFIGDGIATTFQLTGIILNGSFSTGAWDAGQLQSLLDNDIVGLDNKRTYDSTNLLTRNEIRILSVSLTGLVTLNYAPRVGVDIFVYYWYAPKDGDVIDNYFREDFIADMEVNSAQDITDFNVFVSANSDVSANTSARHTHSNLPYLELLAAGTDGQLCFFNADGIPVGSSDMSYDAPSDTLTFGSGIGGYTSKAYITNSAPNVRQALAVYNGNTANRTMSIVGIQTSVETLGIDKVGILGTVDVLSINKIGHNAAINNGALINFTNIVDVLLNTNVSIGKFGAFVTDITANTYKSSFTWQLPNEVNGTLVEVMRLNSNGRWFLGVAPFTGSAKAFIQATAFAEVGLIIRSAYHSLDANSSDTNNNNPAGIISNSSATVGAYDLLQLKKYGHTPTIGSANFIRFTNVTNAGQINIGKFGMVVTDITGGASKSDFVWQTTSATDVLIEKMRLTWAARLTIGTLFSWTEATSTLAISGTNTQSAIISIRGGSLATGTANAQVDFITGTGGSPSTGSMIMYQTLVSANGFRNASLAMVRDTAGVIGNLLFWQKNVTRQMVFLVNSNDNSSVVTPEMVVTSGAICMGLLFNVTAPPVLSSILTLGASTLSKSSLNMQTGVAPSAPNLGDMWYDGTDFAVRAAARNDKMARCLVATFNSTNFPLTASMTSSDITVSVPGAAQNDAVVVGLISGPIDANSCFTAFVSSTGNVTIRFNNYSLGAIDPGNGTYKVIVFKN